MKHHFAIMNCRNPVLYSRVSFLFIFALLSLTSATAQSRFSVELGGGPALATQDLGDADLGLGFGFEGTLSYRFMPHMSAYAGWGWEHFSADESFAGADMDFEETGYTFGLQFVHPFATSSLRYFFGAGGIYNHIELEDRDGDLMADSGHGLGWQVEGGLMVPLSSHWSLKPSVRYRSLSRDLEVGNVTTDADLSYVAFRVGIARAF